MGIHKMVHKGFVCICIHACMHACTHGRTHARTHARMPGVERCLPDAGELPGYHWGAQALTLWHIVRGPFALLSAIGELKTHSWRYLLEFASLLVLLFLSWCCALFVFDLLIAAEAGSLLLLLLFHRCLNAVVAASTQLAQLLLLLPLLLLPHCHCKIAAASLMM